MTWQIVAAANAVTAVAYGTISWIIFSGPIRTGQVNTNKLAFATGLTVAKYALDAGADDKTRRAIEETLEKARAIITELLGERGSEIELRPGDLRRSGAAAVSDE